METQICVPRDQLAEKGRSSVSGSALLKVIQHRFSGIVEHRREGSIDIPLVDALMAGFAVFSLKYPSLLQFEEAMKKKAERNKLAGKPYLERTNLESIYYLKKVPSDTQMRTILDEVSPEEIRPAFKDLFSIFQRANKLKEFEYYDGHYLLSIDGTGYFSSNKIHCESCMVKKTRSKIKGKAKTTVLYHHNALGMAIVHPDQNVVIPLCPEAIQKQDGGTKNDSERVASYRAYIKFREDHPMLKVIVLEDALGGNIPNIDLLKKCDMRFVIGVKPGSHKLLFNTVKLHDETLKRVKHHEYAEIIGDKIKKKRVHQFKYINELLVNGSDLHTTINFLDYTETTTWVDAKGVAQKTEVHYSWITDLVLQESNIAIIAKGGRTRWKIENETFNTLKNQGYEFEHNYGHGNKNLTTVFIYLLMLAFTFDQIQQFTSKNVKALTECISKILLWQKIKSAYEWLNLRDYDQLFDALVNSEKYVLNPNTFNSS